MQPLRSLLFVPGNRPDMLGKARNLDADVLVPDLEDSVPATEKGRARETVREALPTLAQRGQLVVVRVNPLVTGLTWEELATLVGPHLYGISVGKVESPWELQEYDRILTTLEGGAEVKLGQVKLIPWLESARAVVRASELASASPRVVAVAFGAEDFTNDMGIQRTDMGEEVSFPRALVAVAARATGVLALDTPYVNFRDAEGLQRDIQAALRLGYKGKFAIHPAQLEPINTLFGPSPEEVEYARRVVQAFEEAEAQGRAAIALDGKMIDIPVVKRARNLLTLAEAIAHREEAP
ncbi:MAG: HpcH/HpaI aldolase/citrate lyase family protein [Dehalococcoidia bacterium]